MSSHEPWALSATELIERYRRRWELRFEALDEIVEDLKQKENVDGRK